MNMTGEDNSMKVTNYLDIEPKNFESDTVKGIKGRVAIGKADGAEQFCMRVFEIEKGGYSPKHSHDWEHEIFFHSGEGKLYYDTKSIDVSPGFVAFIPGGVEHQIQNKGDSTLTFVCLIPSGIPEL